MANSSRLLDRDCYLSRHRRLKVDWNELPYDLLRGILVKLVHVLDFINFSGVCTSWSIVGRDYLNRYVPYGFPCLLIPGTDLYRDTSSQSRRILSFPVGANLSDNFLPRVTVPHLDLCRGSHFGWLVMMNNNMDMYLLNPFSNTRIDLPSVRTLKKPYPPEKVMSKWYVNRIFLSASPSEYSNCYVLVFYNYASELALYKVGSKTSWQYLPQLPCSAMDAAYFNGKWHISVETGEIYICQLNDTLGTIELIEFSQSVLPQEVSHFLVESRGELFRIMEFFVYKWYGDNDINAAAAAGVEYCEGKHIHGVKGFDMTIRINDDDDDKNVIDTFDYDNFNGCEYCSRSKMLETDYFLAYKLDTKSNETKPSWIQVNNLDGDALFLGSTQSFLLPNPQLFGYKRNHIYFTDSILLQHQEGCTSGYNVGIYNLEDSTMKKLYETNILSMRPPAVWIIPKF